MSVNDLTYSTKGLALTAQFEGCSLAAYQDQVGVWTIGYGHTGPDVKPGLTITGAQAQDLLAQDVCSAEALRQQRGRGEAYSRRIRRACRLRL